jgi:hypothetical protein
MRLWMVGITLLVTCGAAPAQVSLTPTGNYAALSFRSDGGKPLEPLDGIWYVDRHRFDQPQLRVYIAPGTHAVGWLCPGVLAADVYPSIEYAFLPGNDYKMVCGEKGPVITEVR